MNCLVTYQHKFFENIQALTPVIVTALPEMEKIIKKYNIGMVCPVGDIESARECVIRLKDDQHFYHYLKKNMIKAKKDLCWENEKGLLIDAWNRYIQKC